MVIMTRFASILRLVRLPSSRGEPVAPTGSRRVGLPLAMGLLLSLGGSGCDFSKLRDGAGHLVVRGTHHGEASDDGRLPDLGGQSGSREFRSSKGWNVMLTEAIIMTTKVEIMACPAGADEGASQDESDDSDSNTRDDEDSQDEDKKPKRSKKKKKKKKKPSKKKRSKKKKDDEDSEDSEDEYLLQGDPNSVADEDDLPEDGVWIDVPLTEGAPELISDQADGSGRIFAENGAIRPGSYCWVRITFGEFEEPDEDADEDDLPQTKSGNPIPKTIHNKTAYLTGRAQKGSKGTPVKFSVSIDDKLETILDIRESAGKALRIRSSRQPVSLTVSKVYDRFFDGVDFSSSSKNTQIRRALRRSLKSETYVSVGRHPQANLAKMKSDD